MPISPEFSAFLKDQMAGFGPVSIRAMFGGAGVFRDGLMFALVEDETLYFKADRENAAHFDGENLPAFSYGTKGGRHTIMSYRRAPERCLDDPSEMADWCRLAFAAALRSSKPRSAKKPKTGR